MGNGKWEMGKWLLGPRLQNAFIRKFMYLTGDDDADEQNDDADVKGHWRWTQDTGHRIQTRTWTWTWHCTGMGQEDVMPWMRTHDVQKSDESRLYD